MTIHLIPEGDPVLSKHDIRRFLYVLQALPVATQQRGEAWDEVAIKALRIACDTRPDVADEHSYQYLRWRKHARMLPSPLDLLFHAAAQDTDEEGARALWRRHFNAPPFTEWQPPPTDRITEACVRFAATEIKHASGACRAGRICTTINALRSAVHHPYHMPDEPLITPPYLLCTTPVPETRAECAARTAETFNVDIQNPSPTQLFEQVAIQLPQNTSLTPYLRLCRAIWTTTRDY